MEEQETLEEKLSIIKKGRLVAGICSVIAFGSVFTFAVLNHPPEHYTPYWDYIAVIPYSILGVLGSIIGIGSGMAIRAKEDIANGNYKQNVWKEE